MEEKEVRFINEEREKEKRLLNVKKQKARYNSWHSHPSIEYRIKMIQDYTE